MGLSFTMTFRKRIYDRMFFSSFALTSPPQRSAM